MALILFYERSHVCHLKKVRKPRRSFHLPLNIAGEIERYNLFPVSGMMKWLFLLFFCLGTACLYGQEAPALTRAQKDSLRYTRIKERMYKRRVTKEIYRLLFRDVYNQKKVTGSEVTEVESNPFTAHQGKTVRSIRVHQLDLMGASVYDTTRKGNRFQRFISQKVHMNTQEKAIRNSMFLFKEGDTVDPLVFKENERILRQSNVLLDARILIRPVSEEEVEVEVLVQDVWPVIPEGSFSGFDDFRAGFTNHNVKGWTHSNTNVFRWQGEDTLQKFGFRTLYTIPYIKRSFVSGQAGFIWEKDLKQQFVKFERPFLSVETRYAGAFEMGLKNVREYKKETGNLDSTFMFSVQHAYLDLWAGRAFGLGTSEGNQTKRLVVATRFYSYSYLDRPVVSADSNRTYWNQSNLLFSAGFSNRNYKRDLLIFGFGRTEDVPVGSMASVTVGRSNTEFGSRGYAGIRFSKGGYLPGKYGYLYGLADMGSYLKGGDPHQGVLSLTANYFTPLMRLGLSQLRQFVNLRYTRGFNRDPLEYINLTDQYGLRGVNSDRLIGKKRLNLGLETVLFSPGSLLGFRAAHFVYADLGLIADAERLRSSRLYSGFGAGIRLRNEHLTFNTIEFRISWYPNVPALSSPFRFGVSGATSLQLQDFDISAPAIVPLR